MIVIRKDGSRDYAEEKRLMAAYEAWINGLNEQELKELAEEEEADSYEMAYAHEDPVQEP